MATNADVIASARRTLQDYDIDRHTNADLLIHFNGARRALAIAMPHAYSSDESFVCAAGARQTLPPDVSVFFGVTSSQSGRPVTVVEREFLDVFRPGWRQDPAGDAVHYAYDERERLFFDLYPPAVASSTIKLSAAKRPVDVEYGAEMNPAENLMRDPLTDYVIGRALLEDSESPANRERAMLHFNAFAAPTGSNLTTILQMSPNTFNKGGSIPRSPQLDNSR
jgi:hypothetical protein